MFVEAIRNYCRECYVAIPGETGQQKVTHVAGNAFKMLPLFAMGYCIGSPYFPSTGRFLSKSFCHLNEWTHWSKAIQTLVLGVSYLSWSPVSFLVQGAASQYRQHKIFTAFNKPLPVDQQWVLAAYWGSLIVFRSALPLVRSIFFSPNALASSENKTPTTTKTRSVAAAIFDITLAAETLGLQLRYAFKPTLAGMTVGLCLNLFGERVWDLGIDSLKTVVRQALEPPLSGPAQKVLEQIDVGVKSRMSSTLGASTPITKKVTRIWNAFVMVGTSSYHKNTMCSTYYGFLSTLTLGAYFRSFYGRTPSPNPMRM